MRILCETNIPPRYVEALEEEGWTTIATTTEYLHPEADDEIIAEFAATNDWVVFTRDTDFFEVTKQHELGVLFLHMTRTPSPSAVVSAVSAIANAYDDHAEIHESIPGGWAGR